MNSSTMKMLVNENRLNLADKKARDYLTQQMEKYFFGGGADVAAGYIPPSQKLGCGAARTVT